MKLQSTVQQENGEWNVKLGLRNNLPLLVNDLAIIFRNLPSNR